VALGLFPMEVLTWGLIGCACVYVCVRAYLCVCVCECVYLCLCICGMRVGVALASALLKQDCGRLRLPNTSRFLFLCWNKHSHMLLCYKGCLNLLSRGKALTCSSGVTFMGTLCMDPCSLLSRSSRGASLRSSSSSLKTSLARRASSCSIFRSNAVGFACVNVSNL